MSLTWLIVAVSCVVQKRRADKTVADSFDISAIQVQQLNGAVTSHAIVAIAVGLAVTVVAACVLVAVGSRAAAATYEVLDELRGWERPPGLVDEKTGRPSTAPYRRPVIVPPPRPQRPTTLAAPQPSSAPLASSAPPPPPPSPPPSDGPASTDG